MSENFVVAFGTPVIGYDYVGPFSSAREAKRFALDSSPYHWVIELEDPAGWKPDESLAVRDSALNDLGKDC